MNREDMPKNKSRQNFIRKVERKEARKIKARRTKHRSIWFGLGMFGLVGWSVVLPVLLCMALGIWVDKHWPGHYSWTLMCLLMGVIIGVVNAWLWISRERKMIEKEQEEQ